MMTQPPAVITIDGPVSSGKGTISRRLAQHLGWHLLDSGALYRIVAHISLKTGVAADDHQTLAKIASDMQVKFEAEQNGPHIYWQREDISLAIREEACSQRASQVASLDAVRQALAARQRAFRQAPGLIADGRDMGTVIFPDAPVKIFLIATALERAKRRLHQLKAQGLNVTLRELLTSIEERDRRDTTRPISPLVAAEDAIEIDSTHLTIDQVVEQVLTAARNRNVIAS